jgi:hypothetical protein
MHLASMVHGSVRERDAFQQPPPSAYYHHAQPRVYPVSNAASPQYTRHPQHAEQHYQRQHIQSPPSPPAEEHKPSLPSISSLLEIAGGERAASEIGKSFRGCTFHGNNTNGRSYPKPAVTTSPVIIPTAKAGTSQTGSRHAATGTTTNQPVRPDSRLRSSTTRRKLPQDDLSSHPTHAPRRSR